MRGLLTLFGLVATVSAQAVTQLIVPSSTPLPGCLNSRQGTFSISILNATGFNTTEPTPSRRSVDLLPRQGGALTLTLTGGVLLDAQNRTGYIASNYQFQFDGPPQAGAIYTAGWGICPNGTLSLGGQSVFWQCLSGNFYNLYDRNWAVHCYPIYIVTSGTGSVYSTSPPGPESTGPDENTIANGGGTNSPTSTASASAASTESGSASATTTGSSAAASASSSASSVASSLSTSASAAASSASQTAASISSSAFAAQVTGVPQQVLAWVAGVVGAVALL